MEQLFGCLVIFGCLSLFAYLVYDEDFLIERVDKRQPHGKIGGQEGNENESNA